MVKFSDFPDATTIYPYMVPYKVEAVKKHPRRVVMSRDSPRSERDGARNTRI